LPACRAGIIVIGTQLLESIGYTSTPCGIFAVTIYESPTSVMPCYCTARGSIHFQASMNAKNYGNPRKYHRFADSQNAK